MNAEMERHIHKLEKTKDSKVQSLAKELDYHKKSESDLIAKRVAEQRKYEETVSTLISQKNRVTNDPGRI